MDSRNNATEKEMQEMKGKFTDFLQHQNLLKDEVVKNLMNFYS